MWAGNHPILETWSKYMSFGPKKRGIIDRYFYIFSHGYRFPFLIVYNRIIRSKHLNTALMKPI